MKSRLSSKLAIGAIAAALAAPAFAQHDSDGRFGWLTRWIPSHTNMTDTLNGNDFRDNRDSTISRNDVPLDQTTLQEAGQWRSSDASTYSQDMSTSDMSATRSQTAAPAATAALPATAVRDEQGAVAAAGDHTPTTTGPAIVYTPARTNVAETAQHNETIVNESPEPTLADENALRQDGIVTPGESEVTARNPSGVQAVQDGAQRDVYTGIEGAGGTSATTAGRDGEEVMSQ
jgi:hypothetical protein